MHTMLRDDAWQRIRALRSRPPGLAAREEERLRVFGAALQQSEELFGAAAAVSEAAKPLPLFYGVSQAGRAIAAAHNRTLGWKITGHGLVVRAEGHDIRSTVVTPRPYENGSDAYSSVAHALGSDALHGPVTLAQLWAAIPEPLDHRHLAHEATSALEITAAGGNPNLFRALQPARGSVVMLDVNSEDELRARLGRYARTDGCDIVLGPSPVAGRASQATLQWPAEPSPEATRGTRAFRPLNNVAMGFGGRWFLQPLLGTPPTAPKPLLVWWALLNALSLLARYHPGAWTDALDIDAVPSGVELELCLATAEKRMPQLIADAQTAGRVQLSSDATA
jgi:hypothetical protein